MIQSDNLVIVRPYVEERHDLISLLADRITVLPGRVAVLVDPHTERIGSILVPQGRWEGANDSDTGTVVCSGVSWLTAGERVGFRCMHGLRCSSKEFDFIPEGVEVRFYGVACPAEDSIVCLVE